MGLEQNFAQQYREVEGKYAAPTTTYTMRTFDYVVRPSCAVSFTITLPPVGEAKGRIYTILARVAGAGEVVTIASNGDAEGWTNITLNAAAEGVVLYSDGLMWWTLAAPNV